VTFPAVEELIPHRAPVRYVDRVVAVAGASVVTEARIDRFGPWNAVPPFVLVEGLAQSLACLAELDRRAGGATPAGKPLLTGISDARFEACPWGPITFEVDVTDQRFGATWARGRARAGGVVVAEATLQAAFLPTEALL